MNNVSATCGRLRNLARLFLFSTILTGLLLLDNLVVIVRWWAAFVRGGGESVAKEAVHGFSPWLDWACVDLSAVTTLIPFLGCFLACRALFRASREAPADSRNFPFFASYDALNIALGLIGTLWGIIVIGFYEAESVGMEDLMRCLHTALFSTLMAVVWVYLVDHPLLRPWLGRELRRAAGAFGEDDAGVAELLEALQSGARGLLSVWRESEEPLRVLTDAAKAAAESARGLTEAQGAAAERLRAFEAADERLGALLVRVAESTERAQALQSSFAAAAEKLRAERDGLSATLDATREKDAETLARVREEDARVLAEAREGAAVALAACRKAADAERAEAARALADGNARIATLEGSLAAAEKAVEDALARMKRDEDEYARRLAALRDENEALSAAKVAVEARLAAEEKRARAAEADAEASRKRLAKVRSVFGE